MPTDPFEVPADPAARGPWPVGVRTVTFALGAGRASVEIWYPAVLGSEAGKARHIYDLTESLPREALAELPDAEGPIPLECDCYRDLPIDEEKGPYPISIVSHAIGTDRTVHATLGAHWASRGFIAVAMDHPGVTLEDAMATASLGVCSGSGISVDVNGTRDLPVLVEQLRTPSGDFAFLADHLDVTRIAVSGHGEGAGYAAVMAGKPGVRLIMPWNRALAVPRGGDMRGVVYIAGLEDSFTDATWSRMETAFLDAAAPALLVGVRDAGHFTITPICNARSPQGQDGLEVSAEHQLCRVSYSYLSTLWDCEADYLPQPEADAIFKYATTAALEEFLKDEDEHDAWQQWPAEWGTVRQLR